MDIAVYLVEWTKGYDNVSPARMGNSEFSGRLVGKRQIGSGSPICVLGSGL